MNKSDILIINKLEKNILMNSGIYYIKTLNDKKLYIGKSMNFRKRHQQHIWMLKNKRHDNNYLQNIWNKYGEENFEIKLFLYLPKIKKILDIFETLFIFILRTRFPNGYNFTNGGEGNHGWIPSDEFKEKIRLSRIGRKHSEETKQKMKDSRKEHKSTKETNRKISLSQIGNKRKSSSSIYMGVHLAKKVSANKIYFYWNASINGINGKKTVYIGQFKTEIDAAKAYDKYIIENNIDRPLNFKGD